MGEYSICVTKPAARAIKKLDRKSQKKVIATLENLTDSPRPRGCEKLSENPNFYRVRAGVHRIIYHVDGDEKKIWVALVRHRKDAYRDLDKLDHKRIVEAVAPFLVDLTGHRPPH